MKKASDKNQSEDNTFEKNDYGAVFKFKKLCDKQFRKFSFSPAKLCNFVIISTINFFPQVRGRS